MRQGMPEGPLDLPDGSPVADGYANPDATTPYPAPDARLRPVGYWETPLQSVGWSRSATAVTGSWGSTVLDLRTDLRGVNSRDFSGSPLNRIAGVQMWIAVSGLLNNHLGMKLLMSQWGHPVDGERVKQFTPSIDVTTDITIGLDQAILDYWPPGSGYQMRFWQVKLQFVFGIQVVPAQLPRLQVQAGVY